MERRRAGLTARTRPSLRTSRDWPRRWAPGGLGGGGTISLDVQYGTTHRHPSCEYLSHINVHISNISDP